MWTPEKIEQLKALWPTEHSAREIGEMIGFSRNAVIGKARRLKLMEKKIKPELKPERSPTMKARKNRIRILLARKKLPPAKPLSLGISFGQLTNKTCRFPLGDNPPYTFCGWPEANLVEDRPYCDWHTRLTARIVA